MAHNFYKRFRYFTDNPVPKEDFYDVIKEGYTYKYWREFPHKRYDWVLTDDNWVCNVKAVFDDGSVSLCGKWIVTPKQAESARSYRIFKYYKNRIRFNNRTKIFTNSALLTGNWEQAYFLAFGKKPRNIKDIVTKLNENVEDYLMQQLDKLLEEHGVTQQYIVRTLKNMADGKVEITDEEGNTKEVYDRNMTASVRLDILKMFARWKDIQTDMPKLPSIKDNRSITINTIDYKEELKKLKSGEIDVEAELQDSDD